MTLPSWRDLAPGGLVSVGGNATEYATGAWRTRRPVVDMSKCTHCVFCWLFCPEGAIETANGKFLGFDMLHCKGCGICATECPPKAIRMEPEPQGPEGDA